MRLILVLFLFLFMLSSCTKNLVPYSGYLQEKHNWGKPEIEQIQFYTSKDIVLYRDAKDKETQIVNGTVKIKNGKQVEEVVVRAGTPGVAVWQAEDNRFGICFESNDERFLTFGANPEKQKKFYLLASEWNGKNGIVTYNGEKYRTNTSSADAFLLIDLKKTKNIYVRSHTAKGRTVNR